MRAELLPLLRCPQTGGRLRFIAGERSGDEVVSGWLVTDDDVHRYPIRNSIPRFVPTSNYADNFGMQWNSFRLTQLDSHSGTSISASRFWGATNWARKSLSGQWVLDCGCGAGRFAEVALQAGANVVALDYSSAADACWANLRHHPRLHVVQGDIYALPFAPGAFRFVYSLGVLQHTPDVERAFKALPPMLGNRGKLCVDFYEKSWKRTLLPKFWLRPLTKRMPPKTLFKLLRRCIPRLWPLSSRLAAFPVVGRYFRRLIPVANYEGILPLSKEQHLEWSLLDTFDWLAPAYDQPQTEVTVRTWLLDAGLEEVEVTRVAHLVGRGRMP